MADVESRLIQLESAQLVRRLTEEEGTFTFKHTLTQEVAYGSLLLKKRSEIHRHVAQSLEGAFSSRLDEFAAVLARHYDLAGDNAKAFEYSVVAGDAAMRLYAHAEAISHYSRALELGGSINTQGPAVPGLGGQLSHIYLNRGRTFELSGQYREALANYGEMEREGAERGEAGLKLSGLIEQAKLYLLPNPNRDLAKGRPLITQALEGARELNDRAAEAKILWTLMLSVMFGGGDIAEAIANGERSLAIAEELGLREQMAFTMNDLGIGYANFGDHVKAQHFLDRSRELWQELGNLPMLTDNLGNASLLGLYSGDWDYAVRVSDEGYNLSLSIAHAWGEAHSRFLVGDVFLERGEWGRAIEIMQGAIRAAEQAGNPGVQIGTRAELAWTFGSAGAVEQGIEFAKLAVKVARGGFEILLPWPLAVLARLYLFHDQVDEAERTLREARSILVDSSLVSPMLVRLAEGELALARGEFQDAAARADDLSAYLIRRDCRLFRPDAAYLKAQALVAGGEEDQALTVLDRARADAESLGARRMLWQILALSAEVEARRGNEAASRRLRERARETVSYIAEHSPEDLRATFLKLPRVESLMNKLP